MGALSKVLFNTFEQLSERRHKCDADHKYTGGWQQVGVWQTTAEKRIGLDQSAVYSWAEPK